MLKSFKAWLVAREEAESQDQFERGYGYACTELLLHNRDPIVGFFKRDTFDVGVDKAIRDVHDLKNPAKDTSEPDLLEGVAIPGWVKWVARDADGTLCGYDEEPIENENERVRAWRVASGDCCVLLEHSPNPNPNWQQTKRRL